MPHHALRPPTEVLTRGFDPRLSVGSAASRGLPQLHLRLLDSQAAERAFDVASAGPACRGRKRRADLLPH